MLLISDLRREIESVDILETEALWNLIIWYRFRILVVLHVFLCFFESILKFLRIISELGVTFLSTRYLRQSYFFIAFFIFIILVVLLKLADVSLEAERLLIHIDPVYEPIRLLIGNMCLMAIEVFLAHLHILLISFLLFIVFDFLPRFRFIQILSFYLFQFYFVFLHFWFIFWFL